MSKKSEYKCHEKIVALLEQANLSLPALRLTHACYHFIDQHPGWNLEFMNLKGHRDCTARCTDLTAYGGTPGSKDNDMIADGIRDLQGKGIFDVLGKSENGRKVVFRFSRTFVRQGVFYKKDRFSMIDMDWISRLRSPSHVLFYSRAAMVERSKYPQLYLPGIDPSKTPWSASKRGWLRAAARVGAHLGHDYIFIPMLDKFREDIIAVKVNITTRDTKWTAGMLYPAVSTTGVSVVEGGKAASLTGEELKARQRWRKVATAT